MIALKLLSLPSFRVNLGKILVTGLIAFVGGILVGSLLLSISQIPSFFSATGQPLLKFSSYDELFNFVNSSQSYSYYRGWPEPGGFVLQSEDFALSGASEDGTKEYSGTNIQVEGVDEADTVKTDGNFLYVVSNYSIFIIKAYPAESASVLSRIDLDGKPLALFISEDGEKLAVFESHYAGPTFATEVLRSYYWPDMKTQTTIWIYDISTKVDPIVSRNVTIDGFYYSSRMIGDYIYTVVNEPVWLDEEGIKLPVIQVGTRVEEIPAFEIYYSNTTDYAYHYTTILAINIRDDGEPPTRQTILVGATRNIYVSTGNVYITIPGKRDWETGDETTMIYRIEVEFGNIESKASGEVPGSILNQFSMDEYDGFFRVATTQGPVWSGQSRNNVYILNMSLGIEGKLEGLAPGERIYSARFMGERCYIVTFRQIDPFYVIDLSDPTGPEVLGFLKIPGFSGYLHPYDDSHIIGIGKQDSDVKLSLFNVTDVTAPIEVAKYIVPGDWSHTEVLSDHKAFLFDRSKNLLALPISINQYPDSWQGAYVFNVSLEDGFVLRGNITHQDTATEYMWYQFQIRRILYIEEVLYTISEAKVKMNYIDSLDLINEVLL